MKTYSHPLYEMDWIVEGRLCYWKLWGEFSSSDMVAWDADVVEMLDRLPDDVAFCNGIYDLSDLGRMASLREFLALKSRGHPKVGWTLVIGAIDPIQRFILSAATQVARMRTRFVASLDEAVELLRSVDPTLPALDVEQARAVAAAVDARTAPRRASV
ncbi:MAG: hypothetical protein ACUVS2_03445 [Candidatus Flexifilum sp.]